MILALFYCVSKDLDDDNVIYGLITTSIISRAVLNTCKLKGQMHSKFIWIVQALQIIPIGLLVGAIFTCIFKSNKYVIAGLVNSLSLHLYQISVYISIFYIFSILTLAIGVVEIWIIVDIILVCITIHEKRILNENPEIPL